MKTKVLNIESEAGWGQRVDETLEFDTEHEADEFIKGYNSFNNLPEAPSWYMYAKKVKN